MSKVCPARSQRARWEHVCVERGRGTVPSLVGATPIWLQNASMNQSHSATSETRLKLEEQQLLGQLRSRRRTRRQKLPIGALSAATPSAASGAAEHFATAPPTVGQRLADTVARTIGSWRFIIFQSTAIAIWITGNVLVGKTAWDPYPFILLNLLLSFQAAYTAPAIMMSQNRQSEQDRRHAENDYEVNVKAELEIELLHDKIDLMKERELIALTEAVRDLSSKLESLSQHVQSRG